LIVALPRIEAESLLIQIAEQVERFHADIGAFDAALQEAPEVFNPVSVNIPLHVLTGMVNDLMRVFPRQSVVAAMMVGVEHGPLLDMLPNGLLHFFRKRPFDDAGTDFPIPFQHSHDDGFADFPELLLRFEGFPLLEVHVSRKAPDIGFIRFDRAGEFLVEAPTVQRQANPVHHEPASFLCDTQAASDFIRRHAVLGVDDHPDCTEPLAERDGTILKDSPDLDAELLPAALAVPQAARGHKGHLPAFAAWTGGPVRPAQLGHELDTDLLLSEVSDRFGEGLGKGLFSHGVLRSCYIHSTKEAMLSQVC